MGKYYYIKPGTYEGAHAIATTSSYAPRGKGWKKVSEKEYKKHLKEAKSYWKKKKRSGGGGGGGGGAPAPKPEPKKVSVVVVSKKGDYETFQNITPERLKELETKYGYTVVKKVEGRAIKGSEVNKAISEDIGKIPLKGGGTMYYSKAKAAGKTPEQIVEEYNIRRLEESKVTMGKLESGEKSVWLTPEGKLVISKGTSPPFGMREEVAKERGYRRISPENIEIKENKIIATVPVGISKAPATKPEKASPEELIGAIGGAVKLGRAKEGEVIKLSPEEYRGYEILESKEKELKEKKELELKQYEREFEEMHPVSKGVLSVAIGLKNIPDIAELTYLKATGQEEKWRKKRAEMLKEFKQLGKEIVEKPAVGVTRAVAETFTEGAGQIPLYAGLGYVTTPIVGSAISKASQIGPKTGMLAKGLVYTAGAYAVSVPAIDVTMEAIQGNMENVVRKSAQYGTEFGAFALGAISAPRGLGVAEKFKPSKLKPKTTQVKGGKLPKTWAENPEWSDVETVHQNVIRQMRVIRKNAFKPLEKREMAEIVKIKFSGSPLAEKTETFVMKKHLPIEKEIKHIPLDLGKTLKLKGAKIEGFDDYGRIIFKKGSRLYYLEVAEMEGIHPDYVAYRIISNVKGKPKVILKGITKAETIRSVGRVALEKSIEKAPKMPLEKPKPKIKTFKDIVKDVDKDYSHISEGLNQKLRLRAPKTEKSLTEKLKTKTATKEKLRLRAPKQKSLTEKIELERRTLLRRLAEKYRLASRFFAAAGITSLDRIYSQIVGQKLKQRIRQQLKLKAQLKEREKERIQTVLPVPI
ncbi:MAG: hypothetical protein DRJ64_09280, partial [Thermoprotei archaeon]